MRFKAQTAIKLQNTYLEMDSSNGITLSYLNNNDWTISFWAYIPEVFNGIPYVLEAGSHFWIYYRALDNAIKFRIYGSDKTIPEADFINQWSHFVVTRSGSTNKIYFNNTERFSYSVNSGGSARSFKIGGNGTGNLGSVKFSQFTFHNKALSASEISMLYGGIGYEDLSGQQKLDLSVVAWHDFVNDLNDSNFGKNYNGGSSDYDFTAGNYSNVSLEVGNFAKRINGRVGDRISEIISSDPDERIITTNTTSIDNFPRYKQALKPNNKPIINFNQTTLTGGDGNTSFQSNQTSSHHLIADIPSLSNKDLTIFMVVREAANSGGGARHLFGSAGIGINAGDETLQFRIWGEPGVIRYQYSTDGTSSGTKKSERFAAPIPNLAHNLHQLLVFELNEDAPKVHVNNLSTTKDYYYGNDITFKRQVFPNDRFSFGARLANTVISDKRQGDMAEFIIYNKKLSSASVETVKEYLNAKYDLY